MKRIIFLSLVFLIVFSAIDSLTVVAAPHNDGLIKVIILSGKNNHEWQKTTPQLNRILKSAGLFTVSITEKPDTFSYSSFKQFDLVLSNWNSWPDNIMRMSNQWERDFLRFVNEGGGVLSFHAGASSFYDWDAYHRIGIGRWGKETRHGPSTRGKVSGFDQTHSITKGMGGFYIMDEMWENTDIYPGSKSIGSLSAKDEKDGHLIDTQAFFVSQTGKGKCFFTTFGHDERALLNTGLQTLLLRAAQWCSGRKVTVEIPFELRAAKTFLPKKLSWAKTDTSLTLNNQSEIVWRFNYNNRFGKPYFHPLTVNNSDLTCVSPPDHPWHLGLWFSWKFINGVNYWEYIKNFSSSETGFKTEGITSIKETKINSNPDFSSDIRMKILYHPVDKKPVLEEERITHISPPSADGSYFIDEDFLFKSLADTVILDRTPIPGEPGGQSWGGYAGLSIRFNQDFTAPELISPSDDTKCPKCDWLYMGFNSLTGEKVGLSIFPDPKFTTAKTSWYVISDPKIPFYYYSPAILFDGKILLKMGETLRLKYRTWMLAGVVSKEKLEKNYNQYINRQ
ncbi:MAG: DUF6807 family protein [Mariniphaga sp.]